VAKGLVVAKPGSNPTETELVEFCRSRIAHFKCPRSIEFLESLPKTATGKILKKGLRKKYWSEQERKAHEFTVRK
jgi:fatty-acyl-CoA synthase